MNRSYEQLVTSVKSYQMVSRDPFTRNVCVCVKVSVTFLTARKRSFRKGNVFTHVCHSVHRRGGVSQHASQVTWPNTISAAALVISLSWCKDSIQVTSNVWWDRSHDTSQADPPPPRIRSMSGRYASYWNAFLLKLSMVMKHRRREVIPESFPRVCLFSCHYWLNTL